MIWWGVGLLVGRGSAGDVVSTMEEMAASGYGVLLGRILGLIRFMVIPRRMCGIGVVFDSTMLRG